jgi:predicted metal-dependent peptidase
MEAVMSDNKEFDLNMNTARLLMDEPFFAAISRRIDKRASTAIPTAGVMVNPATAQFEMLYNPAFFTDLTDLERTDVLKHEFYHVLFEHVTGRFPVGVNLKLWNIATDLAINSHLQNLPAGGLIPGQEGTPFADLPRGESAEWYMANMPDFSKDKGDQPGQKGDEGDEGDEGGKAGQGDKPGSAPGDGDGIPDTLDDHSGWQECSQEVKEMAKERLKDAVRKAANEASASSRWGSVSSEVRKEVMKMLETKVDWRKVLRYFVKSSQRADRTSSIKRINRRYAYIHPGRKSSRVARVAVSVDQSGSVDDGMLALFFAELNKLASVAEFVVVPFDTRVDESKVFAWRKGQSKAPERVLQGGTDFNAPTEYVNKHGFDGHIILTDMGAPKPRPSKCQRMWMTTKRYADSHYFDTRERVVAID